MIQFISKDIIRLAALGFVLSCNAGQFSDDGSSKALLGEAESASKENHSANGSGIANEGVGVDDLEPEEVVAFIEQHPPIPKT